MTDQMSRQSIKHNLLYKTWVGRLGA